MGEKVVRIARAAAYVSCWVVGIRAVAWVAETGGTVQAFALGVVLTLLVVSVVSTQRERKRKAVVNAVIERAEQLAWWNEAWLRAVSMDGRPLTDEEIAYVAGQLRVRGRVPEGEGMPYEW